MQLIEEENNSEYLNQQPRKFYLDCSGSDTDILKVCPTFEINRHSFTGQLLLFTSFFACIGGAYLFYLIFENIPVGIFFGLLYGGFIFTLDRAIISDTKNLFGKKKIEDDFRTIDKPKKKSSNNIFKTLLVIFLRMGLAIMSSFIVAKSIELYVFSPTIELGLSKRNSGVIENINTKSTKTIEKQQDIIVNAKTDENSLKEEISKLTESYDLQYSACLKEKAQIKIQCSNNSKELKKERMDLVDNGSDTRKIDLDITNVYQPYNLKDKECELIKTDKKIKLKPLNEKLELLQATNTGLINSAQSIISSTTSASDKAKVDIEPKLKNDKLLPARFAALSEALENDKSLGRLGLWLSLFLLGIELTPLFRKLVMPRGKYEAKLEQVEEITTMQYDIEIQAFEEIGASSYKEIEKIKAKYEGEFKQKIETIHNLGTNMADEISAMENEISEYFINKLNEIELEPNEAVKNFKMKNLTTMLNLNIQTVNKMAENYTEILQKKV